MMKTYLEIKAVLARELLELEQLTGLRPDTIEKRYAKEQQLGRHCYQAEEDLHSVDLRVLKKDLGLNETQWRAYKARFIEGSSPEPLT